MDGNKIDFINKQNLVDKLIREKLVIAKDYIQDSYIKLLIQNMADTKINREIKEIMMIMERHGYTIAFKYEQPVMPTLTYDEVTDAHIYRSTVSLPTLVISKRNKILVSI